MGFFRRCAEGLGHSTPVAGIAEAAPSWGWEAVDEPFSGSTTDLIMGAVRTLHGVFRTMRPTHDLASQHMHYRDAYRGTRDGRTVTVANAWTATEAVVAGGEHVEGGAVTAVELSTLLLIAGVEPRMRHQGIPGPEVPTGNASFDSAYRVVGMARLADHSADDLLARIAHIDTLEQALAFLQQLSDADRQRLAASPTPLAKFAEVRSPDEAIARMMALPEMERLQLLAMFQKADRG